MTEEVLAFGLTVTCADDTQHQDVELKTTETTITYTTADGVELKGDTAVQMIESGIFLVPLYIIEAAIQQYRRQT